MASTKKVTETPLMTVDKKRSIAAKKGAVTRAQNRLLQQKRVIRLRHKITAGSAITAVIVFTFFGIRGQLEAYAASTSTGSFVGIGGKCLDNSGARLTNHNRIQLYKCNGSTAQKWLLTSTGSLKSNAGSNYCLDVPGNSKAEYTYVQLYKCNDSAAQHFTLKNNTIISKTTGYCVTDHSAETSNNTKQWMKACHSGSASQKWIYSGTTTSSNGGSITTPSTTTSPTSPSTGGSGSNSTTGSTSFDKSLDVNPSALSSSALSQINSAPSSDKALLSKITSNPIGTWFTDNTDVTNKVKNRVASANSRNAIATLVMYNIPRRDCGNYSAGGAVDAGSYQTYVNQFVAGLGSTKEIVIVEPDGLPLMSCLSSSEISTRYNLISYAAQKVAAQGSYVYIDAGTDVYQPLDVMTTRLKAAGVQYATGFAMNISMFRPNNKLITYGTALSKNVGGKHFVIDTSRNGMAVSDTDYAWCNPTPRGLGTKPTENTGTALLDAYLWIKPPGESDGGCDGAPGPGEWYQSYALMLAKNAAF